MVEEDKIVKRYESIKSANDNNFVYTGKRRKADKNKVVINAFENPARQSKKQDDTIFMQARPDKVLKSSNKNYNKTNKKHNKTSKKVLKAVFLTLKLAVVLAGAAILGGEINQAANSGLKANKKVWKEAEVLEADTDIISLFKGPKNFGKEVSNKFPHNGKDPIYVSYSKEILPESKKLYEDVLDYYENLFKTIDNRYSFKEVSQTEAYMRNAIGQSVIFFEEGNDISVNGYARTISNLFQKEVIGNGQIKISTKLNEDSNLKYNVILHEIAHIFGLGDGQYLNANIVQSDSFMFASQFNNKLGMLYPNDIKLFHLLYNQNISDKDGNTNLQEVEKINSYIKNYEIEFYNKVAEMVNDEAVLVGGAPIEFDAEEVHNVLLTQNCFYLQEDKLGGFRNQITVDLEKNKVSYKILDYQQEVVYETESDIIVRNNIIFIPTLTFEKGPAPMIKNSHDNPVGDMFLAIYKDQNNFRLFNFSTSNIFKLNDGDIILKKQSKMFEKSKANVYQSPTAYLHKTRFNNLSEKSFEI